VTKFRNAAAVGMMFSGLLSGWAHAAGPTQQVEEEISVRGICAEDHVGVVGEYSGRFWRKMDSRGNASAYGSVYTFRMPSGQEIMDRVLNPGKYELPSGITFLSIPFDTLSSDEFLSSGLTDAKDGERKFRATCRFAVTERVDKIREMEEYKKRKRESDKDGGGIFQDMLYFLKRL